MEYNPKGFNIPDTEGVSSLFGRDFHQVAIYTRDIDEAVVMLSMLGFRDWHRDTANLNGEYLGRKCSITGLMAFNYQVLNGRELEFVKYIGHPSPRYEMIASPFISHLSSYVDDVDKAVREIYDKHRMLPYHLFTTSDHTNPRVAGKKHFREAIYETSKELGFNLKLIEKVIED